MRQLSPLPLLMPTLRRASTQSFLQRPCTVDVESLLASRLTKDENALWGSSVGERLPYNDYTTIDWLHDLVKDSVRRGEIRSASGAGLRARAAAWWDSAQGWVAAFLIGILTAIVAFVVDIAVATVADWKEGYCASNIGLNRRRCCPLNDGCQQWRPWANSFGLAFVAYVGFALVFGIIAGGVTMTTKTALPAVDVSLDDPESEEGARTRYTETASGKTMYMAAGSGIPEIKTILSGFVIPRFLDVKVLVVKAVGATFAVATGMCLGKERAVRSHRHLRRAPGGQLVSKVQLKRPKDERDAQRGLLLGTVRGFRSADWRRFVQLRRNQHLLSSSGAVAGRSSAL